MQHHIRCWGQTDQWAEQHLCMHSRQHAANNSIDSSSQPAIAGSKIHGVGMYARHGNVCGHSHTISVGEARCICAASQQGTGNCWESVQQQQYWTAAEQPASSYSPYDSTANRKNMVLNVSSVLTLYSLLV